MHSFTVYKNEEKTTFHYNSDLSGSIDIAVKTKYNLFELRVPASVLLDFVANWVRNQKVAALEEQSTREVFGLGSRGT